ncbi:DNA-binding IclR family transcriptional regulator [Pedobacter sp. AK017]|uniref:IclR family transcriptional regulator n=1 Tax=Pedobacter sp. AK017 TaxID=2723073 RepID=UPI0016134CEA|nr:IclR family transcriptional regulator [Pedobacter sp. AK017]MBB5441182.1 DNA-binding IclR family transcriptional regulator [Pedobacter sp. AK017]
MIQVINRALRTLEYVAKHKERSCSLSEIAESLQLHQPTCANILKTLVDMNYLEHLGRKKGYRLGAKCYELTGNLSYNQNLLQAAKGEMEALTKKLNETCILGILRNQKRFIVHTVNSDQDLQVRSRTERDLYETASGRILLAFLPEKERESLINAIGLPKPEIWKEAKTKKQLDLALADIRNDNLVITLSPQHIVGLAVPIIKDGVTIASLSIFLPESRYNVKNAFKTIITTLKESAKRINELLQ